MNDYSHIKKIIDNNFEHTERQLLLEVSSYDIMRSLDSAQSIMKEFHTNIVTQSKLSDIDKKILSFFFNMTVEQNLRLVVAIKQGALDIEHIHRVYADVLHERAVTASIQFLHKIYFPQRIKGLMQNDHFQEQMQSIVDKSYQKWPLAQTKFKYIYKSKKFYEDCMAVYIQKHAEMTHKIIYIHRNDVLDQAMCINPSEGMIVNFFAHEALHFSDPIPHNDISDKLFVATIEEKIKNSHEEVVKRKESEKQKNTWKAYKQEVSHDTSSIATTNQSESYKFASDTYGNDEERKKFDDVYASFQQAYDNKSKQNLAKIEKYVWRMYKNKGSVYMKYIQDTLGPQFDDEITDLVRDLCTKLDLSIVELEKFVEEVTTIKSVSHNQQTDVLQQDIKIVLSPTLRQIQDTPEKLTTEVLITICKELGYRFWDEKEFMSYANDLGLGNSGKSAIFIKKKLIDYLIKPENDVWMSEGSKETKSYEKLTFNDGSRMVKQKRTMLWLTDHETYEKLIQRHFTTNKTDFDKLLQYQSWGPGDIDPSCI